MNWMQAVVQLSRGLTGAEMRLMGSGYRAKKCVSLTGVHTQKFATKTFLFLSLFSLYLPH